MTVLFVTHVVSDANTAVYANIGRRARFLQGAGHDARVVTPSDLGVTQGRLMPVVFPFAVAWWILRRAPFDVIAFHSHTGWVYQLLRVVARRHRHSRVAVTFHGLDILYVLAMEAELRRSGGRQSARFRLLHLHILPRLTRWSCRRADRVFFMNAREREFLLANEWVSPQQLRWMPNSLDAADFVERTGSGSNVQVLTVAQWLPVKGTRYLVEAFAGLIRQGIDMHLTCAGTLRDSASLLAEFPPDVRPRVTNIPSVPHAEVGGLYAAADVFVLASISEGFSVALLEAMAAGLAIVATSAGAAADILTDGEDAILVPPADPAALAAALRTLVEDPARRRSLGDHARARAAAFTANRVLPQFVVDLLGVDAAAEVRAG